VRRQGIFIILFFSLGNSFCSGARNQRRADQLLFVFEFRRVEQTASSPSRARRRFRICFAPTHFPSELVLLSWWTDQTARSNASPTFLPPVLFPSLSLSPLTFSSSTSISSPTSRCHNDSRLGRSSRSESSSCSLSFLSSSSPSERNRPEDSFLSCG